MCDKQDTVWLTEMVAFYIVNRPSAFYHLTLVQCHLSMWSGLRTSHSKHNQVLETWGYQLLPIASLSPSRKVTGLSRDFWTHQGGEDLIILKKSLPPWSVKKSRLCVIHQSRLLYGRARTLACIKLLQFTVYMSSVRPALTYSTIKYSIKSIYFKY